MGRWLVVASIGCGLFAAPALAAAPGFADAPRAAPPSAAPRISEPTPLPAFPEPAPAAPAADARTEANPDIVLAPPDLPEVTVIVEAAQPTLADRAIARPVIAPPDLPEVTVVVEPAPAVRIAPPDLPDVRVVVAPPPAAPDAVAAALRARLDSAGAPSHPRLTRALRDDVAAFYAARGHAPLWVDAQGLNAGGRAVLARLARADDDALDAAAYAVPAPAAAPPDADRLAALDLDLSVAAVLYARDARGGRIDAKRLTVMIDPTLDIPAPSAALERLAAAADPDAALASFNPPHAGYRALRDKLREARRSGARTPVAAIPQGPVLRPGMSDARVPLLRERLKVAPTSDAQYDAALAEAVAGFQRERGLPASGALTRQTVAALSSNVDRLEADLIANMERWRWLPADLGERHIEVNIPEFQARVVMGGEIVHQTRVIVGKPDTPTPIFSDAMQFIVVNPSWYVPPSILKKEFLPKLAQDPTYAERRGYQVIRRGANITIRQPPGERNALGNVKFMFPNKHSVYLHDTPTRHLFGADRRAFSHGCVRVDQPFRLAEIVLGKERGWSEQRVRGLVGRGEQTVRLEKPLPIHLTYFTLYVDELGRLQQRDDLYGYHRRVRAALGLDG